MNVILSESELFILGFVFQLVSVNELLLDWGDGALLPSGGHWYDYSGR